MSGKFKAFNPLFELLYDCTAAGGM